MLVIYLLITIHLYDSPKSTVFILNRAFDVLWSAAFVKYSKLESFVSCNIKFFDMCFFY